MKTNDILKEENAGKIYIIKNKGWEGTKVTVTDYPNVEIDVYGERREITDLINLRDVLDLEFEEEKPCKEISGREALKLLVDGGVVYGDDDFDLAYYIEGDGLVYEDAEGSVSNSKLLFNEVLNVKWIIKN